MRTHYLCAIALSLVMGLAHLASAQPKTGAPAPDFTLKDQSGTEHKLSQYRGKVVVLEWTNPGCPFVVKHYEKDTMTKLAAKHPDVVWLTINSSYFTNDADNAKWAKSEGVQHVLNDASGKVGQAYGARTTPHMFVIGPDGALAYQGAIDDNPHFDARDSKNYVDAAIADLKAKRPVKTPEVRPYGCSVKYKR